MYKFLETENHYFFLKETGPFKVNCQSSSEPSIDHSSLLPPSRRGLSGDPPCPVCPLHEKPAIEGCSRIFFRLASTVFP